MHRILKATFYEYDALKCIYRLRTHDFGYMLGLRVSLNEMNELMMKFNSAPLHQDLKFQFRPSRKVHTILPVQALPSLREQANTS